MEERHRARDKEKRLYARLPGLEESPKTYAGVELFFTAIEEEPERAGLPDKLYELCISQMTSTLRHELPSTCGYQVPGLQPTYERLVEAMAENVAPGKPEGHLLKEVRALAARRMSGLPGNSWTGFTKRTWPYVAEPARFR